MYWEESCFWNNYRFVLSLLFSIFDYFYMLDNVLQVCKSCSKLSDESDSEEEDDVPQNPSYFEEQDEIKKR